jgi:hypothetical protein
MTKPRTCGILFALVAAATLGLLGVGPVAAADAPTPRVASNFAPTLGTWGNTKGGQSTPIELELQKVETIIHTGHGSHSDSFLRVSDLTAGNCGIDEKIKVRPDNEFTHEVDGGGFVYGFLHTPTLIRMHILNWQCEGGIHRYLADLHPVGGR